MIGIVRHEMKWYSRNNRRLWCFNVAKAEAEEVCMSSVDTAFLHGLTTQTDGMSLTFFQPMRCKACQKELVRQPKKRSAQPHVSERKSFCGSPLSRGGVLQFVVEKRDGHQKKKRGTVANIGQEQKKQVKKSRLASTLEKDDPKVTHSDKMHCATHEDA